MTKHVVVTGGAGFIGSNIVDAYLARGWFVTIIDNLSTGKRRNVDPRAALHELDIRDAAAADLIRELKPDVISHHAAQMDVRKSVDDPAADADVNVIGTLRLLEAAVDAAVKRVIFASTGGAIYGEPVEVPQTESHPLNPLSPYGCAKLAVERYLNYYRVVRGLSSVALRYANVYGPRQNAHGEAGVVAIFAAKLIDKQQATINGTGEQTRDFVYVDDVVAANLAASDAEWQGEYNVGTGVETTINELYDSLAAIAGVDTPPVHAPAKEGEQLRSVLDGSRLRTLAKLPERKTLSEGLKQTFAWFAAERSR
ncbi:MAG TPA: NAD-dependent epimerase/dehydratase family protein [Thermoanaerobaculia bacterium]|nr:NAD-dependent epimerase/dehydratase family protein [Thermoanaerobaculia bacterium]